MALEVYFANFHSSANFYQNGRSTNAYTSQAFIFFTTAINYWRSLDFPLPLATKQLEMQKQNLFCWYSLVDETSKFSKIKQCRAAAAGVPRGYRPSPIWIRIESVLFYGISHVSWVETCSFHAKNVAEKCWNRQFRASKIAKKNFLVQPVWLVYLYFPSEKRTGKC